MLKESIVLYMNGVFTFEQYRYYKQLALREKKPEPKKKPKPKLLN